MKFQCQMSGKCCKSQGGEAGFVNLTESDLVRLEKYLDQDRKDFAIEREFDYFRYETKKHTRWVLKGTSQQCPFLKNNLCSIHKVKPIQCQTWPFWPEYINADGTWNKDLIGFCAGLDKGPDRNIEDILKLDKEEFFK